MKTSKIRMTEEQFVADHGLLETGTTYELPKRLADQLVTQGKAKAVATPKPREKKPKPKKMVEETPTKTPFALPHKSYGSED